MGSGADDWLVAEARAKVNLRLRIFPRGADGFHPLETVFCRISLADRVRLRFRDEPGVSLRVTGRESAPSGPANLAARAAALFLERFRIERGVEVQLEKHVPPGSGLGGGSSDAAAVLRLLAGAVHTPLGRAPLLELGAELGSDVPFFVADTPLAPAGGRGERLLTAAPLPPRPMLLLLPPIVVSSADAYRWWDEEQERAGTPSVAASHSALRPPDSWESVGRSASNDLESVIFARHASLGALKRKLEATGPHFALLAGSGAALFAVYESPRQRDGAAVRLEDELGDVRVLSVAGPV